MATVPMFGEYQIDWSELSRVSTRALEHAVMDPSIAKARWLGWFVALSKGPLYGLGPVALDSVVLPDCHHWI
jgi:uncharacterized membrane protein